MKLSDLLLQSQAAKAHSPVVGTRTGGLSPLAPLLWPNQLPPPPRTSFAGLYDFLAQITPKRKVFVSYHHKQDQWAYNLFSKRYGDTFDIFTDRSLEERILSSNPEYVNRTIREDHIKGSSVTIVLCGSETWKRKYVDWEIYSTLHHRHALLGIGLHNISRTWDSKMMVPCRLYDNWLAGYALFREWWQVSDPAALKSALEDAIEMSRFSSRIQNWRLKMFRNAT